MGDDVAIGQSFRALTWSDGLRKYRINPRTLAWGRYSRPAKGSAKDRPDDSWSKSLLSG